MILLTPHQRSSLQSWFFPERPVWMVGMHVLQTGVGAFYADRWPEPRVILAETAGNYSITGDPAHLQPGELIGLIRGFVDAPNAFVPFLQQTFPDLAVWERVTYVLQSEPQTIRSADAEIRRLVPNDGKLLEEIHEEMHWIWNTWGDPDGLASSGYAWGAFVDGSLVSIACSFFIGENYEELGVVTDPDHRRRGFSAACTVRLCEDILARGKQPSWSTSPENDSSLSVAEKVGFTFMNNSCLYVIGIPILEEY